jgi:hypothetical protein
VTIDFNGDGGPICSFATIRISDLAVSFFGRGVSSRRADFVERRWREATTAKDAQTCQPNDVGTVAQWRFDAALVPSARRFLPAVP